jgi:hypothetical protein
MKLVELLDEHFGHGNGEAVARVLRSNPEILAEWMTETRLLAPVNVWRVSFAAERSGSRHGPASFPTHKYIYDDPETTPLQGPDRFGTLARLCIVRGIQ